MTTAAAAILEIRGLKAGYGSYEVLHGLDLDVPSGTIVALLGHNGGGKSTLLKGVFGVIPVSAGSVRFAGEDATRARPFEKASRGMRLVPQDRNTFPDLTVEENLRLGGLVQLADGRDGRAAVDEGLRETYELFPILRERRLAKAGVLSGGERQMLAMSIALMTRPRLILLDEPSAGLAPIMVQRLFDSVRRINKELGAAILLVEQNVSEALRLAEMVYVLQEGRLVFQGPSQDRERIIRHLWGLRQAPGPGSEAPPVGSDPAGSAPPAPGTTPPGLAAGGRP